MLHADMRAAVAVCALEKMGNGKREREKGKGSNKKNKLVEILFGSSAYIAPAIESHASEATY
jgi:hypothetical protein